jgi:hypothetical protein
MPATWASAKWVDIDVAKEMFPDKAEDLDGLVSRAGRREPGSSRTAS